MCGVRRRMSFRKEEESSLAFWSMLEGESCVSNETRDTVDGMKSAKANHVLRPGGVIVLTTPKFGGSAYRMHRSAWHGFRHGYHTVLFSGKTLGACLEASGFEFLQRPKRDRLLDDVLILWGKNTGKSILKTPATKSA